jgi:DNA-directed RNA polymerase subunit beta
MGRTRAGQEDHHARQNSDEFVRRELKALFKDTVLADTIADMPADELEAIAPTLTEGVFMGSPVFGGSRETEIKALLDQSGLRPQAKRPCTTA